MLFDIAHHTDDDEPGSVCRPYVEAFSQRIFTMELALGQRFADERDGSRFSSVMFIQKPSAAQRNLHGLAIVRADGIPEDGVSAKRIVVLKVRAVQSHNRGIIAERQEAGKRGPLNSGYVPHLFEGLLEKAPARAIALTGFIELMSPTLHLQGQHVRRSETWIDAQQSLHAAQQQSGGDQQYQRQSDFGDYQDASSPRMAADRASRDLLQSSKKFFAIQMQRRHQARNGAYQSGYREGEGKHRLVDGNRTQPRQLRRTQYD